jgi:16S rRNA (adenine1518-N6/adenine1519-N6)-dimethyltransferase
VSPQPLGQHFLSSKSWRDRIAREMFGLAALTPEHDQPLLSGERKRKVWIEIGAGHGEMTELLAPHASRLIAIELDDGLLPRLRETADRLGNVSIVAGDVLDVDIAQLADGERFSVYGNLPYYITSPIVHRILERSDQMDEAFLVMQLEVAERLVAKPGHREYAYLSAIVQFYADAKIRLKIPAGAFRPPPKVASALVSLRPPGQRLSLGIKGGPAFGEFLKRCFAQKRKTLRNNLIAIMDEENAAELLRKSDIAPKARAEELNLQQFARLFELTSTLHQHE